MTAGSLTVVVPLHDGASFIADTLDSLEAQTVPLAEVIVVDDGSRDHGPAIVERHPVRPTLLRQPNLGVAAARNRGALAARTRFVAFLDQDDLWLPHRHQRLLAFLHANPSCLALATSERSFFLSADRVALDALHEPLHETADHPDVDDTAAVLATPAPPDGIPGVVRVVDTADLLRGPIGLTISYVLDRELFFAAGGCPTLTRSADDYLMLLGVSRLAEIPLLDEPSVLYRIHPGSTAVSTSWPLPLLTLLTAVRFGGNLVPESRARDPRAAGTLSLFWRHQLLGLARSRGGLLDGLALTRVLASGRGEARALAWVLTKAALKAKLRGRG